MTQYFRQQARKRRRGTASIEAIVILPFFIFMFASVYYMHAHYSGRQQAMLIARTCLWKFAAEGCKPEDKEELTACLAPTGGEADEPDLKPDDEHPQKTHDGVTGGAARVLDVIQKIPVLKNAIAWLFGKPVSATALYVVKLPAYTMQKKERYVAAGSYHTLCNSPPKNWGTLAKEIFCGFLGAGTLGC